MINCKDLFLNTHKMNMFTYAFTKLTRKMSESLSNCEAFHADGNEKLQETRLCTPTTSQWSSLTQFNKNKWLTS